MLIYCGAGADRVATVASIAQVYLYGFSVDQAIESSFKWDYWHTKKPREFLILVLDGYKNMKALWIFALG